MMGTMKYFGLLAIIPTAVMLAISFFVLVVNKKQEAQLKAFGYVVAGVLWLAALVIFSSGVYVTAKGGPGCMKKHKMHGMMKEQMQGPGSGMKGHMPMPIKGSMMER